MKSIYYQNQGEEEKLLFRPDMGLEISNPVLTREIGCAGSLQFEIYREHEAYEEINPFTTFFLVKENDVEIFRGRNIGSEEDFYRTGNITCEGDLAFFYDSVMRPYEHTGSITEFLELLLDNHNSQVEERKQFMLGVVTVEDSNDYINRSSTSYDKTLEALKDKLVDTHGGYLRTRKAGDTYYLDYVEDYGGENEQQIRFGENLLDLTKFIDSTQIITALIPTGAETETDGVKTALDITSVNDGKDFIYNSTAVETYGWIWGQETWKDITTAEELMEKAEEYLDKAATLPLTMQLSAVDLIHAGADVQAFQIGYQTEVVAEINGVTGWYVLKKIENNLADPAADTITLGGNIETLTDGNISGKKNTKKQIQGALSTAGGGVQIEIMTKAELDAICV